LPGHKEDKGLAKWNKMMDFAFCVAIETFEIALQSIAPFAMVTILLTICHK
jgi:hypothetical protein